VKTLPIKIILGRDNKLTILKPAPPEPKISVNRPVAESIVPLNFATDQSMISATIEAKPKASEIIKVVLITDKGFIYETLKRDLFVPALVVGILWVA
jgi:NifB/MoaA-like Fe-S oxidoreductase